MGTKLKPYNDLYTFSTVPNSGMCVQNAKVQGDDLKLCLHLNKDVQEEDDFYGGLSEKPKEEDEEEIDIFKMIQDRYSEHEKFVDDYIASIEGESDPGLEDYPDVNLSEGDTSHLVLDNPEDSKEFPQGSGAGEL